MTQEKWIQLFTAIQETDDMKRAMKAAKEISKKADKSHVSDLRSLLRSENQFTREVAAYPLLRLEGLGILPELFEAMQYGESLGHDNDGLTHAMIELIESDPDASLPFLLPMLESKKPASRADAAWAMSYVARSVGPEILINFILKETDQEVRCVAVDALQIYAEPAATYPVNLNSFKGQWMWLDCADDLRYGFNITSTAGICIKNNADTYAIGDVMLKIAVASGHVFVGKQIFTNGYWYPVTGILENGRLSLRGGGHAWTMDRI